MEKEIIIIKGMKPAAGIVYSVLRYVYQEWGQKRISPLLSAICSTDNQEWHYGIRSFAPVRSSTLVTFHQPMSVRVLKGGIEGQRGGMNQ